MKKFIVIVLVLAIAATIIGCNPNKNTGENELSGLSSLAPDPKTLFPDLIFEVVDPEDGDSYQFILKGATREMFEKYVEECKDGEFTKVIYELENTYQARTADDLYYVSVSYSSGSEEHESYVYVSVNRDKEEE